MVKLPFFSADDDPGPDFMALARRLSPDAVDAPLGPGQLELPHGTTCVTMRYKDGVVIAGDRRATSGHHISHRTMEKVFSTDRHSAVAIAGAAGPAIEMVRLFQLQLEHYEKVEGHALSLDGKANQLSQMLRSNLPAAMQGMAVVPLFAGYDLRRDEGRLFQFDITGGRYEEREFGVTGSGSMHANTVVKLGYRRELELDQAVELVTLALFEAADEDAATGGPDFIRGLYPVVASITADGYERVADDVLEARYRTLVEELTDRGYPT